MIHFSSEIFYSTVRVAKPAIQILGMTVSSFVGVSLLVNPIFRQAALKALNQLMVDGTPQPFTAVVIPVAKATAIVMPSIIFQGALILTAVVAGVVAVRSAWCIIHKCSDPTTVKISVNRKNSNQTMFLKILANRICRLSNDNNCGITVQVLRERAELLEEEVDLPVFCGNLKEDDKVLEMQGNREKIKKFIDDSVVEWYSSQCVPIYTVFEGLKRLKGACESIKEFVRSGTLLKRAELLARYIQGQPYTRAGLIKIIRHGIGPGDDQNAPIPVQVTWVSHWIRGQGLYQASDEECCAFLRYVTGHDVIVPGKFLLLKVHQSPSFWAHDCSNTLDLPLMTNQGEFIKELRESIKQREFNVG